MKLVILKIFPRIAYIIEARDKAIAENTSLKLRIKELEKLVKENSNLAPKLSESAGAIVDNVVDFSVTVFEKRFIPGRKDIA